MTDFERWKEAETKLSEAEAVHVLHPDLYEELLERTPMFRTFVPVVVSDGRVEHVEVTMMHGSSDKRPVYGCAEPREHVDCGGTVIDHESEFINCDGDEFSTYYKCLKCGETFMEPREWMFE